MSDGRVHIVVRVILEQTPHAPVGAKRDWAFGLRHFQQAGQRRVAGDVASDVLLSVVGAHLLLVDVLFKDVTQYVRVDFVVVAAGAVVQMPLVLVEKPENLLERGVRDVDVRVVTLQRVGVKDAPVKVRHLASSAASSAGRSAAGWPRPSWNRRSRNLR